MLAYDDSHWHGLLGGYRTSYDPRTVLRRLDSEGGADPSWKELWDELHHQGDVDVASYAALVVLADIQRRRCDLGWNLYALVGTIEMERHRRGNPEVPLWLRHEYDNAWQVLRACALADLDRSEEPVLVQSALAVVALSRGLHESAAILLTFDESEVRELLDEQLDWSKAYRKNAG
jgi:hypothetical protein